MKAGSVISKRWRAWERPSLAAGAAALHAAGSGTRAAPCPPETRPAPATAAAHPGPPRRSQQDRQEGTWRTCGRVAPRLDAVGVVVARPRRAVGSVVDGHHDPVGVVVAAAPALRTACLEDQVVVASGRWQPQTAAPASPHRIKGAERRSPKQPSQGPQQPVPAERQ